MMNLIIFLCSLIIQFGVVGYGDIAPNYQYLIDDCQSFLSSGNSWMQSYSRVPDEYWYAFDRGNGSYWLMFPREVAESNFSSSETVNSLIDDYGLTVTFVEYVRITYDGSRYSYEWPGTWSTNIYYYSEENTLYPELLYLGRESFYYDGEYQVNLSTGEDVMVDIFSGIGSLGSGGHSSGGNPLEDLESFSWDKNAHTFKPSGHSIGVSSSSATYDYSNAEQNLLAQVVDNTNDLISNTNNIGGALETINNNLISGISALYNGISQFNNNFITSYVYDEEKVNDTITNSSMFAFANATTDMTETIINESDVLLDAVHDMEEKQDLVIYLDLTKWRIPVYSSSTGVNTSYVKPYNEVVQIDFSFLKETKSIWQPILLGILYLSLFLSIYFDLPNILRGANG